MKKFKRFIAGAVCPRCAEIDKLQMHSNEAGEQVRECVRCGYSDRMTADGQQQEIKTRVNTVKPGEQPLRHEDELQIVKIMQSPAIKKPPGA